MITRKPTPRELEELRYIAELQFGVDGHLLIPDDVLVVVSPSTGKIRAVVLQGKPYLGIRPRDYRFNLYIASGVRLNELLPRPKLRVYVKDEYAEFAKKGKTIFCRHVLMADPGVRYGDEVLAVDSSGRLLAVGRSVKSGLEMVFYRRGEAVKIREGAL